MDCNGLARNPLLTNAGGAGIWAAGYSERVRGFKARQDRGDHRRRRGFGRGFGEALAADGAHVVLIDIDGAAAEEAAAAIRGNARLATGYQGDVTDEARMNAIMAEAAALQGGIDILINNAGLHSDEYGQPITKMGFAKTKRLFEVNVFGTICCTLAAAPASEGQGRGLDRQHRVFRSPHAWLGLRRQQARHRRPDHHVRARAGAGQGQRDLARADADRHDTRRAAARDDGAGQGDAVAQEDAGPRHRRCHAVPHRPQARFITGEVLRVTGGMAAGD